MNEKPQIWYPYNETFGFYHDLPLAGKRAKQFIDRHNDCKGGHWVLHTREQHYEWHEKKGKHLEFLGLGALWLS